MSAIDEGTGVAVIIMPGIPNQFAAKDAERIMAEFAKELETASLAEAFKEAAPAINAGFEGNFSAQVSSSGSAWPPRKDKLTHPLLILSGAMKAAVSQPGAAGHVEDIQDRQAAIGIDSSIIVYAAAQNFGYPKRNLPAREYVFATDETMDKSEQLFTDAAYRILVGV